MTAFAIEVTCPQCAGPVDHVNGVSNGFLAVTVVECAPCDRQWEVSARLSVHRDPDRQRASNRKSMARARNRGNAPAGGESGPPPHPGLLVGKR